MKKTWVLWGSWKEGKGNVVLSSIFAFVSLRGFLGKVGRLRWAIREPVGFLGMVGYRVSPPIVHPLGFFVTARHFDR